MSARMLQRALRNNQPEAPPLATVSSDQECSESEAEERQAPAGNPFDLLGLQDDDEMEDVDVERDSNQLSAAGLASTSAPTVAVPSKAKKKKNKGKKKGKKEVGLNERPVSVDEDEDSVDKLLARLVVGDAGDSSSSFAKPHSQDGKLQHQNVRELPNILAVDVKHLRAEDELRRIFGSKVINSVERRREGGGAQRRRQGGGGVRRAGRSMPLRKSLLVVPMENWIRWDGGISMECIKVEGQSHHFRYEYSSSYEEVQKSFEECVASHDPNTIMLLLRSHPYHVDSLLALAEVYKQMGEHQQSANLLEKCLYALECAWHPWFNPSLGTCRLEFSVDTNKALFLSLFRHMQHLGRRGCHRTALEVCKFLLSLDSSDPLGALFCIDYFALRAEQYEWLQRFVDEYETDEFTALLPNFSFSGAVAYYYLEIQMSNDGHHSGNNVKGAAGGNNASAASLIQQALMLHPSALRKIIAKAPIKEDSSWAKVVNHPHFNQTSGVGPTLEHLIDIYVERNYLIWRSPELQSWLKEGAAAVIQIADKSRDSNSGSELANWECVRNEVFDSDENKYKHLYLSEFSDSTSTLPPEEMPRLGFHGGFAGGNMEMDGGLFEEGNLQQRVQQAAMQGRNALMVFLQSLVPWMDHEGEPPVEDAPALLEEGSDQYDEDDGPL